MTKLDTQIQEFLENLTDSPCTQKTYQNGLRVFCKSHLIDSLDEIDTDVLQEFKAWLSSKKYARFTQKTYIATLVAFLTYALGKELLPDKFSLELARAKLKQVTRRSSYPIPRPDPHIPSIISYYDKLPLPEGESVNVQQKRLEILRSRAFVHLLYSSAGRLAEVASLDCESVDYGRSKEALVTGKGDKERFLFITPEARAAITTYLKARNDSFEPLFISHRRGYGNRLNHHSLRLTISDAAKLLGFEASPHAFRHYRASQLLGQGAPMEAVSKILGHSDIGTTSRVYAHYSSPKIRSIFDNSTLTPQQAEEAIEETQGASARFVIETTTRPILKET